MIKLSLEVPTVHLEQFDKFQDFNYVIQPWLLDRDYFNYYGNPTKILYLDNGVNEYGEPTSLENLLISANWLSADAIVAPDMPDLIQTHLDNLIELQTYPTYKSIGVLCDSYRSYWRDIIELSDIVAIPYDITEPRYELFNLIPKSRPIHFLGFRSLVELQHSQDKIDSIDTGIPIKLALKNIKIEDYTTRHTIRRDLITPKDYHKIKLTKEQYELAIRNTTILRLVCSGHSPLEAVQQADRGSSTASSTA